MLRKEHFSYLFALCAIQITCKYKSEPVAGIVYQDL